jgi:DNA repair protein RecO (recombination protein O)
MQWSDDAIVLAARRLGEGQAIVSLLAAGHGRWRGVVPGGNSRARRPLLQQGTRVVATWRARHAGQLGTLTCELVAAVPVRVIGDRLRLTALTAATALIDALLPEREPNVAIYRATLAFLAGLGEGDDWLGAYADWEALFIAEIGFGLTDDRRHSDEGPVTDTAARLAAIKAELARSGARLEESVFTAEGRRLPFARARLGQLIADLR